MSLEQVNLACPVAIVTGPSSGIGRDTAITLAEAGAAVVVNYIGDQQPADEVVETIEAGGGRALAVKADVSDGAQVQRLFQQSIAWLCPDVSDHLTGTTLTINGGVSLYPSCSPVGG